jgi:hypothetical protein
MPSEDDASAQLHYEIEADPESSGVWSNQEVAESNGEPLNQVTDRGRVDGYKSGYHAGHARGGWLLTAYMTLSVYDDQSSAAEAFERGPQWTGGDPLEHFDFGDASLSWPMTSVDQEPRCPCQVWVRVGRLVGTVDLQSGGDSGDPYRVPPGAVELARAMATRMAEAQG